MHSFDDLGVQGDKEFVQAFPESSGLGSMCLLPLHVVVITVGWVLLLD